MAAATLFAMITAIVTRLLFALHTVITVWRVVVVYDEPLYWFLALGLVFLLIETLVTLIKKKGQEWKWVCPSFFFYLCCVVPGIWLLEKDRLENRRGAIIKNQTLAMTPERQDVSLAGVKLSIELSSDMWTLALEQILLLLLIIGRWMLPKGEISRDELSQLLFVYIGMASDIMELFILFDEKAVLTDKSLGVAIMVIWAISLLQYCIVYTSKKARNTVAIANDLPKTKLQREAERQKEEKPPLCPCIETEIWSIMTMVVMQDGPFLTLRLYSIIKYKIFNYTILFFTCKNALILLLQFYRIVVIVSEMRTKADDETESQNTNSNDSSKPQDLEKGGGIPEVETPSKVVISTSAKKRSNKNRIDSMT